jgi:hypothetical protein
MTIRAPFKILLFVLATALAAFLESISFENAAKVVSSPIAPARIRAPGLTPTRLTGVFQD